MNFIIKRKVLIAMLFIAVTMLGFFSYRQLPVELIPNAQLPFLFVQVGSSLEVDPKYMESQAVIPLEGAIGTLGGVEKMVSNVGARQATIQITFSQNTDIKFTYLKLLAKVDEVKKTIPTDFYVQVVKFDLEQMNNMLMTLQVRGSGGSDRIRQIVDKEILDRIQNINGIANVGVYGGRGKTIEVRLNDEVCKANGISPADVRSAISRNSSARSFAGKVSAGSGVVFVNVVSEFNDVVQLQDIIIKEKGQIRLRDIADIRFGVKDADTYSRVNGKESVTMQLTRDTQSNMIDLANRVKAQVEIINKDLKQKDIEVVIDQNRAEVMEKNVNDIIKSALIGGILSIIILWIFLRNLGLVVAIALSIPISIYAAFNFFYAYGITINSLTLLGIALAVGMLLDNSVVVMENIYRLATLKIKPDEAVLKGTTEVWRSIVASTLTTVMVFLPFAFSRNLVVGIMGKHIGVSIISTLLISLAVALILIPMITHLFLKMGEKYKFINFESIPYHSRVIQILLVFMKSCMRNPARVIIGSIIVFFILLLTGLGLSLVKNTENEEASLNLYIYMSPGSTLDQTDKVVSDLENRLVKLPERKDIVSKVYNDEALITINLVKNYREIRNNSVAAIKDEISGLFKQVNANCSWEPMSSGGHFGSSGDGGGNGDFGDDEGLAQLLGITRQNEKIILKGQDYNKLLNQAELVKDLVSQVSSVRNVNINIPSSKPELQLVFDKSLLTLYNIPASGILSELNSFPRQFSSGTTFKQGADVYDILIVTQNSEKEKDRSLNDLKQLPVKSSTGAQFELQNLSEFLLTKGFKNIKRTNQEKQLTISFKFIDEVNSESDLLEAGREEVRTILAGINPNSGIVVDYQSEDNNLGEFKYLFLAALLLIYMIMASVFESLTTPLILMCSIPLSATGSIVALILTGNPLLNANTIMGLIILIGVVVNNGIILLDYSNILQKRGYRRSRSLLMASLARLRPILITSVTTIIALFPLAMSKSEYASTIGVPFAVTVIGGLSLSTLLTLVFIPTFYNGLNDSLGWWTSQAKIVRAIQLTLIVLGAWYVYIAIDSTVWKIIDILAIVILVPSGFYFVKNSLRKANAELISENETLHIKIRNLVKIYDRDSKFMREWKSGIRIRQRLGLSSDYSHLSGLRYLTWNLPLAGFLVYFIFIHTQSGFWYFILPIIFYIYLVYLLEPLVLYINHRSNITGRKWGRRWVKFAYKLIYWALPLVSYVLFYKKFGKLGLIIPGLIIWYFIILVKRSADKLYSEKLDIERLKGAFSGIRKSFYRLVKNIPIVGKKKQPFKALRGVSLEIENGMFGLLGPNGAGKSTLMRIVCGILEPSYGQILINGFDTREKREELQGLIGYLPQEFGMYENLTAWEFLNFMAILKKLNNREVRENRIEYVLNAVHMIEHKDEKIGSFSGGMKQRIGIAQILLHLPKILVVDEPTAGLDPRERIRFRNLLVELSRNRIVIFSTHIIEDVASSCNRVAVVKSGELRYLGRPIDMVGIAEGRIWSTDMSIAEFESFKKDYEIIHHMRDGQNIKVRFMSETPPSGALAVKANLEDAYLCLLTSN